MPKIIAAYIAHGHRPSGAVSRHVTYPIDAALTLEWKRITCLFAMAHALSDDAIKPRLVLITDHPAPAIDGRLIGVYLARLGVELHRVYHLWRPYHETTRREFYVFDAMEHLSAITRHDDEILIFSGRALAINSLDHIFSEFRRRSALFVEASSGEIAEEHNRALRERMAGLRRHFAIRFPDGAICSASPDFLGLTHAALKSLLFGLRMIFMKNILRASRGEDHFANEGEMLAALLARDQFYQPDLVGLSDHAAAMPDDFSVSHLPDVPVILPGYGREPSIEKLFHALLGDRLESVDGIDQDMISRILRSEDNRLSKPRASDFLHPLRSNEIRFA